MVKPGYKLTEIGEIPEDWGMAEAQQLMRIETGSKNTEDKIDNGRFPFFVRSPQVERINSYHYDCEAVLTAGDGVGTGKTFHYYNGKFDAHQRVYVMSQFNGIHAKFFYYYFSENFGSEVAKYTAKSSVDSVRRPMIAEMIIPLPAIKEQERIAEALSDVDGMIASLEKMIAKKKAIKQGAMQRLLTGKTRLPGFSGEWKTSRLGDIVDTSSGGTPSRSVENYYKGNIPWITTSELCDGYIYTSHEHISDDALHNSSAKLFHPGTVLMAMYGATIGKLGILGIESATNQACCALICGENIFNKYLYYYLLYIRDYIVSLGSGAGQPNISQKIVQNLPITLPEYREQVEIGNIFFDIDNEIESLSQKLAKTRQLKQGMMQQLLTGKIRLYSGGKNE